MGLHPDVKKYLKTRFPNSVNSKIPSEMCENQICDLMWLLFKYRPEESSTGSDLVDFFWRPIEQFFIGGGNAYVCVFDTPQHVPVAKSEEHKRRYGGGGAEPLESNACDEQSLPHPWHAALACRTTRAKIVSFITAGISQRFVLHTRRFKGRSLIISGANAHVRLIDDEGERVMDEHTAVADVGEGDLAVAYWAQHFNEAATVVRVLDSDQIPILQLRAHLANRKHPLYVWLVTPKRPEDLEYHGYTPMPFEDHTLVNVLGLNDEVRASGLRVEEFCFQVICQKTDFVDKVISNLGVQPSLAALEKNASGAIRVTASAAKCDPEAVKKSFRSAALHSKRKRAEIRTDGDVELRRAWWTLCYWAYAWRGKLPDPLTPRKAFGFDEKGFRTTGEGEPYPVLDFK